MVQSFTSPVFADPFGCLPVRPTCGNRFCNWREPRLSNVSTPNPAMSEARGELQRFQMQVFHRLTPEERLNLLSGVAAQ